MSKTKRVFVIGGTGFIGSNAVQEFLKNNYKVTILARNQPEKELNFPKSVKVVIGDLYEIPDKELLTAFKGNDVIVFAAGVDDRVTFQKPSYPCYKKANVTTCTRVFKLAKKAGMQRGVVLSSYFAHFARFWNNMDLENKHPYIKSRLSQEKCIQEICDNNFSICILELPYIFGVAPGKKPLWCPLIQYFKKTPIIFYSKGGTNIVSVETVANAIVAASEKGENSKIYLIGEQNINWVKLIRKFSKVLGQNKPIITLPKFILKLGTLFWEIRHILKNEEPGLDPTDYVDVQVKNTFFDPQVAKKELGFEFGDVDKAIKETVKACT